MTSSNNLEIEFVEAERQLLQALRQGPEERMRFKEYFDRLLNRLAQANTHDEAQEHPEATRAIVTSVRNIQGITNHFRSILKSRSVARATSDFESTVLRIVNNHAVTTRDQ